MRKLTILIVVILLATILGGCITDSDVNKNNKYSGIEEKDISDLNDLTKIDFVYIYKGTSDNLIIGRQPITFTDLRARKIM